MDRSLLEERLRLCANEVGWPLDTVKSVWEKLFALEQTLRSTLTPARLGHSVALDDEAALKFLLAGVRAQLLEPRWQVFHPVSGWILEESDQLGGLSAELLYDPFSRETVEPDLGSNVLLVFRPAAIFFEGYRLACLTETWEAYRAQRMAWPFVKDGTANDPPLAYKAFNPWELGKLEVVGRAGDVLRITSLETRSQLTLRVGGTAPVPRESFILKMESFRTLKVQETTVQQTLDLQLVATGFDQTELEVPPGRLVVWVDNRSGLSTGLAIWRTPVLSGPQSLVSVWNARSALNHPLARATLINGRLPEGFHLRVGGEAFLFAGFENSAVLMDEHGDKEFYQLSRRAFDQFVAIAVQFGGFVFQKGLDTFALAFPSALDAAHAAVEAQKADQQFAAIWKFTIFSGNVLLTPGEGGFQFFGHAINLGRHLLDKVRGGELWVAMAAFGTRGVPDFFLSSGYDCRQEMVSIKNEEQQSLVYECRRTTTAGH